MTYTRSIDNDQDIMDSRDVIAYMEDLKNDIESAFADEDNSDDDPLFDELVPSGPRWFFDDDLAAAFIAKCETMGVESEAQELVALFAFADEAEGTPDWFHGETLIRESYWVDYARQLAEDVGALGEGSERWPNYCIDWERAASDLKMDYFTATFDGVDYYVRA